AAASARSLRRARPARARRRPGRAQVPGRDRGDHLLRGRRPRSGGAGAPGPGAVDLPVGDARSLPAPALRAHRRPDARRDPGRRRLGASDPDGAAGAGDPGRARRGGRLVAIFDEATRGMQAAMKAKDEVRLTALRAIRAAFLLEMKKDNAATLSD